MKYNMFIGRYQSPHLGHMKLFDTYLNYGHPVLIAIRDVVKDDKNLLSARDIKELFETIYQQNSLVKVIIIPDIESVNYGRDVGYSINCINVDSDVESISGTYIREQILSGKTDWKEYVHESIHDKLKMLIKK
jgi:adenylylsulfate kinase